jgi:hypothetical protein
MLDLESGAFRDLMDCRHMYAFIVLDYLGRAYHPMLGGDIARYDPRSDRVERLKQTIDGGPIAPESHLADEQGHPINWDVSPDRRTLYAVPMSTNALYSYDLTNSADTLAGICRGPLVRGAKNTDCRAMCVGASGQLWASVTEARDGVQWHHLVSYRPGDAAPRDHGLVAIENPNYTEFVDATGRPLPYHGGLVTMPDGTATTRYVTMGVCEAADGAVYTLVLHPYTLLEIPPDQLKGSD